MALERIDIDGSFGEGGGQIVRSSLGLSLVTGRPFRITNIRRGRKKPGLMRQHVTAVNAAVRIGRAAVRGNELGSSELRFEPREVRPGTYHFSVGTAGSCTLVLQTVLPALLTAGGPSELTLEGGTHNPFAPPFDFLARAFLPLVNRMGPTVTATLARPGFYPAGGGRIDVRIEPAARLTRVDIPERGAIVSRRAQAIVARLPRSIADRELDVIRRLLSWKAAWLRVEEFHSTPGPGNTLSVEIESDHVTEVFTGFGQRGVPAEEIARKTARTVQEYLGSAAPVGRHLADQLLIPMALAGGGRFRTLSPTGHTTTNAEVLKAFLDVSVSLTERADNLWEIDVGVPSAGAERP